MSKILAVEFFPPQGRRAQPQVDASAVIVELRDALLQERKSLEHMKRLGFEAGVECCLARIAKLEGLVEAMRKA